MRLKWLPWKFILKPVAHSYGLLEALAALTHLEAFSRPGKTDVPIELVRMAVLLHARGLINSQAIQHNLDWVWPFWAERQFDPQSPSFIPRAFSLTHVNLTHRNWTAVGLPGCAETPIIDPRGLVTPYLDGWSIDIWGINEEGADVLPSKLMSGVSRELDMSTGLAVRTLIDSGGISISSLARVIQGTCAPELNLRISARTSKKARLALALRPYNPEGISFIHDIACEDNGKIWRINGTGLMQIDQPPLYSVFSCYSEGDVYYKLRQPAELEKQNCDIGMATAAAVYELDPGAPAELEVKIPLPQKNKTPCKSWEQVLRPVISLDVPQKKFQFLFEAAVRTILLLSAQDPLGGPYTYRYFWFRDAAMICYAMLCCGLTDKAADMIARFPSRMRRDGYFLSQDGEWDSNGQALWIAGKFCDFTGGLFGGSWPDAVRRGGEWIMKKKTSTRAPGPHAGLMPAGLSAEHFGPSNYYYWDDFWSISGLKAASALMEKYGDPKRAAAFGRGADELMASTLKSLDLCSLRLGKKTMSISPYRRMDSGAVGTLSASYPLRLFGCRDERVKDTLDYLMDNCLVKGGFFHDIAHSGINPYLTLHMAQALLRMGDQRFYALVQTVSDLASSTGQWPEAIHPHTDGGCMGDGQHAWAAAEWIIMMRNLFCREENDRIILCSGLNKEWLAATGLLEFGPAPTEFGVIQIRIEGGRDFVTVNFKAIWHRPVSVIEICPSGYETVSLGRGETEGEFRLKRI